MIGPATLNHLTQKPVAEQWGGQRPRPMDVFSPAPAHRTISGFAGTPSDDPAGDQPCDVEPAN